MRRHRQSAPAALVVSALLLLPGLTACGDGSDERAPATAVQRTQPLSAREQSDLRGARLEIYSYCHELNRYLARKRGPPTQRETGRAYAAVDRLAAIARGKPAAQAPNGRTVWELMGDIAEDLEGSNCAENVQQRLDRARAGLASP